MMGWGSFSSAVGSGGTPRAAMGPGLDGPGPSRPGQIWGNGGAYGGQRGAGSRGGGILPPLVLSSPVLRLHFSRSITPIHR